jgi:predicted dinucleotide-utilizing enzyme
LSEYDSNPASQILAGVVFEGDFSAGATEFPANFTVGSTFVELAIAV